MSHRIASQDASGTSTSGTCTATYPATPQQYHMLLAVVMSNTGTGTHSLAGWTSLGESVFNGSARSMTMFVKIAGAGEATGVTATATGATVMRMHIAEFEGIWTESGTIADAAVAASVLSNQASATSRAITTSTKEAGALFEECPVMVLTCIGWPGDVSAVTYSDTATGQQVDISVFGSNAQLCVAEADVTDTTTFGVSGTWAWTTSRTHGVIGCAFRLKDQRLMLMGMSGGRGPLG
jgi:hypothetical protein